MMATWTSYYLSEPMLKRLAKMVAGHPSGAGTTMLSLERRGMATDLGYQNYPSSYEITDRGREALAEARAEGW